MAIARDSQLTCECGSTFFYTTRAEQFAAGGYGSAEFRSLSNAPKTVLVCLCGKPVTPKPNFYGRQTTAGVAEDEFRKSVEFSQRYRKEHSLENIAQIAVSPEELQKVADQVDELRKVVERPVAVDLDPKPKSKVKIKAAETKV